MLTTLFKRIRLQKLVKAQFSIYPNHRTDFSNSDSLPFDFTPENYLKIEKILEKYPKNKKRSAVMPLLYIAQDQSDNFVSLSAMKKIAKVLQISEMDVYEVASFYTMFNRTKVGKFHLQVCGTTPCQLCGSREIIKTIEDYTKCHLNETSEDGLFTISEVECLGACSNAPMMQVNNEEVYEDLTPENVIQLLENLKNGMAKPGPQIQRNYSEGPQGRTCLKDISELSQEIRYDRNFQEEVQKWKQEKEQQKKK